MFATHHISFYDLTFNNVFYAMSVYQSILSTHTSCVMCVILALALCV